MALSRRVFHKSRYYFEDFENNALYFFALKEIIAASPPNGS